MRGLLIRWKGRGKWGGGGRFGGKWKGIVKRLWISRIGVWKGGWMMIIRLSLKRFYVRWGRGWKGGLWWKIR